MSAREEIEERGSSVNGETIREDLPAAGYAGFRGPVADARSLVQDPSESHKIATVNGAGRGEG